MEQYVLMGEINGQHAYVKKITVDRIEFTEKKLNKAQSHKSRYRFFISTK